MRRVGSFLFLILLGLAFSGMAVSSATDFDVTPVAKGVYAAIGEHGAYANGAFVVNENDVIVIDTQLRPSWAREVIAEIKKVTDKPVRYVINTHWHRDHVQGNQAYRDAFPGVTIIQHDLAREDQIKFQPGELATRAPKEIARLTKILNDGIDDKGNTLSKNSRAELLQMLDLQNAYVAETPQIQLVPGTLTFDQTLSIHEPDRQIDLHYFGYAHTRGDIVVYLPKEKVVIAGDLIESGVPVMRTAYPMKLLSAGEALENLDWDLAIPGHGPVEHDKKAFEELLNYERDLIAGVQAAVAKGMTESEAIKSIDLSKYAGMPDFQDRNTEAIQRAFLEISGKISY